MESSRAPSPFRAYRPLPSPVSFVRLCARAARHRRRWDKKAAAAAAAAATSRRVRPGKAVHAAAADPENDRRLKWKERSGFFREGELVAAISVCGLATIAICRSAMRARSVQRVQIPRWFRVGSGDSFSRILSPLFAASFTVRILRLDLSLSRREGSDARLLGQISLRRILRREKNLFFFESRRRVRKNIE